MGHRRKSEYLRQTSGVFGNAKPSLCGTESKSAHVIFLRFLLHQTLIFIADTSIVVLRMCCVLVRTCHERVVVSVRTFFRPNGTPILQRKLTRQQLASRICMHCKECITVRALVWVDHLEFAKVIRVCSISRLVGFGSGVILSTDPDRLSPPVDGALELCRPMLACVVVWMRLIGVVVLQSI